jgi:hypothetical protein
MDRIPPRAPPTAPHGAVETKRIGKDGKARARPKKKPLTPRERSIDARMALVVAKLKKDWKITDRELRESVHRVTSQLGRPRRTGLTQGLTQDQVNRFFALHVESGSVPFVTWVINTSASEDVRNAWNNASEDDRKVMVEAIRREQLSKFLPSGSQKAADTYLRKGRRDLERDYTRTDGPRGPQYTRRPRN